MMMHSQYQLTDICFSYPGRKQILAIKQQAFYQGKISALIGANGTGKSTLLKLLALLLTADTGALRFSDVLVTKKNSATLRKKIGLVLQNPYLLQGSVRYNIGLGLKLQGIKASERDERVQQMLSLLQLEHVADHPATLLSGGEAQKVAIGRILVLQPDVVLLDEPFTHIDPIFAEELSQLIRQLKKEQKTVLFTSHDRSQAQALSDRVYSIVGGAIVQTSLYNCFKGKVHLLSNTFDTGKIKIAIPKSHAAYQQLSIEPNCITLSSQPLVGMQNAFPGKVKSLSRIQGKIQVLIQGAEAFYADITPAALDALGLKIDDMVFVNFKPSATCLF